MKAYYIHYCTDGFAEKRVANDSVPGENTGTMYQGFDYSLVFDAGYYISRYKDAEEYSGGDEAKALEHFVMKGMKKGRQGNEAFDPVMYRTVYSDIRETFGDVMRWYYIHYIQHGKSEGR